MVKKRKLIINLLLIVMVWFMPPAVHGRSTDSKNNRESIQIFSGDLLSTVRVLLQRTLHANTNSASNITGYNEHLKEKIASYFRQHSDSPTLRLFAFLFPNLFGQPCPTCDRNCGKCPVLPKCPPVLACEICKVCEVCTASLIGTPLLALPPPELLLGSSTLLASPDVDKPALGPAELASVLSVTIPTTTPQIFTLNSEPETAVTAMLLTTKPPALVVKPESEQTTVSTTKPPVPNEKPEQTAALTTMSTTTAVAPSVQELGPEYTSTKPPPTLLEPDIIQECGDDLGAVITEADDAGGAINVSVSKYIGSLRCTYGIIASDPSNRVTLRCTSLSPGASITIGSSTASPAGKVSVRGSLDTDYISSKNYLMLRVSAVSNKQDVWYFVPPLGTKRFYFHCIYNSIKL